jgi:hypothetical protein
MTRSDITSLPPEILSKIFHSLTRKRLFHCQIVCRAWYPPAHKLLSKDLWFRDDEKAKEIFQCLDRTPDPYHLNAVESVEVDDYVSNDFDADTFKQVFPRFPNLESVKISDSSVVPIESLDEDFYSSITPRLKRFMM